MEPEHDALVTLFQLGEDNEVPLEGLVVVVYEPVMGSSLERSSLISCPPLALCSMHKHSSFSARLFLVRSMKPDGRGRTRLHVDYLERPLPRKTEGQPM